MFQEYLDDLNKQSLPNISLGESLSGFSGEKLLQAISHACKLVNYSNPDQIYVEVGVFQGLSLTSVCAANPSLQCFGIDNFSQFDSEGRNKNLTMDRLKKFTAGNGSLIDLDFEDALINLNDYIGDSKVGVYFIDGPHDYRSQYLCLEFAKPNLGQNAFVFVDDSNYEHVRQANYDWLVANPDYTLLYERYTDKHPVNMRSDELLAAKEGWWNGVNILVHDPDKTLARKFPKLNGDKSRFYNDHIVHQSKYQAVVTQILKSYSMGVVVAALYPLYLRIFKSKLLKSFSESNID